MAGGEMEGARMGVGRRGMTGVGPASGGSRGDTEGCGAVAAIGGAKRPGNSGGTGRAAAAEDEGGGREEVKEDEESSACEEGNRGGRLDSDAEWEWDGWAATGRTGERRRRGGGEGGERGGGRGQGGGGRDGAGDGGGGQRKGNRCRPHHRQGRPQWDDGDESDLSSSPPALRRCGGSGRGGGGPARGGRGG